MAGDPHAISGAVDPPGGDTVAMPRATIAPLTLSLGLALLGAGLVVGPAFLAVGGAILAVGLGLWVAELLPGAGHAAEPLAEPSRRAGPVRGRSAAVEHLRPGMPGYRLRLPSEVHPISAGVRGGLVGGLVMPLPALAYGLLSGHGLWYPVNLLAGMVLPGVGGMSVAELEEFRLPLLVLGIGIHAALSVVLGLLYGVLLPTLPAIPRPLAWGGLLMPLLWSGVSFALMRRVDVEFARGVDWPWFIACQFAFGVAAAVVVHRARGLGPVRSGLLGGVAGGLVMPLPALIWGLLSGRGLWYPANLLAGMILSGPAASPAAELQLFHPEWLAATIALHGALSIGFGLILGLLTPRLPDMPAPLAWGGLLLPLLWTGTSYSLMGVVNPLLQRRVDWPWFVASQFVYGVCAAVVVVRSEKVSIPPAGRGPDRAADFVAGPPEDRP